MQRMYVRPYKSKQSGTKYLYFVHAIGEINGIRIRVRSHEAQQVLPATLAKEKLNLSKSSIKIFYNKKKNLQSHPVQMESPCISISMELDATRLNMPIKIFISLTSIKLVVDYYFSVNCHCEFSM